MSIINHNLISSADFFDLNSIDEPFIRDLLGSSEYVWDAIKGLTASIKEAIQPNLPSSITPMAPVAQPMIMWQGKWLTEGFELVIDEKRGLEILIDGKKAEDVAFIAQGAIFGSLDVELREGAVIEPCAFIKGPAIIGSNAQIRHCAYIRGDVFVDKDCVVGHTTEVKHSIFLNGAKAGHFAYIGDSILGIDVNLGAGTKLANLRLDRRSVRLKANRGIIDTNIRKFGAIIGDKTQIGCNTVTNPGALIYPRSLIGANSTVMPGQYGTVR